jgi:AGCS family alanine or glycine:cation symporter
MGSTPHAHALADVKSAHEQGTVAMVGVFIDTFVVLTLTALIVISTLYAGGGVLSAGAVEGVDKSNMLRLGIATLFNGSDVGNMISAIFVAVCLTFFAFSTIISWNMFGKINFNYLFGKKATIVYSILSIAFIFLGSILSNDIVWELADLFNYLMVIPNVLALVALSNVVVSEVKARKKKKLDNNETTENQAQNDSEPLENQQ